MISSFALARRTAVLMLLGFGALLHDAHAARRPGAPRPLRLVQLDGTPLPGEVFNGVLWRARNSKELPVLFFSCASNGTRNLWRAVPDASNVDSANLLTLTWRAAPLTRLNAPYFADSAAPLPDGRGVLCVSNVLETGRVNVAVLANQDGNRGRIARLDVSNGRLNALTPRTVRAFEPAVSPDGAHFAFVASSTGRNSANALTLFIADFEGSAPTAVENARHPRWLDNQTLLVQGTKPGSQGIYRVQIPLALDGTQLLFSRPGSLSLDSAASPDGTQLCVAETQAPSRSASVGGESLQQLYLLSSDGSGARAVTGTTGAANPSFAPDGDALLFDAPLQNEAGASTRGLWLLPLNRSVPVALLLGARAIGPEIAITGTAFCEGEATPRVRLEVGQGNAPTRWTALNAARPPIHQSVLARWRPPADASGDWLLRLTVSDGDGNGTQSTYPLSLPLEAPPEMPSPVLPGLPLPALPPAPQLSVPLPQTASRPQPRLPQPRLPQPRLPQTSAPQAPLPQTASRPQSRLPQTQFPQTASRPQAPLPQRPSLNVPPLLTPVPVTTRPTLPAPNAPPSRVPPDANGARPSTAPLPSQSLPPRESNFQLQVRFPPRAAKTSRRVVPRTPSRRPSNRASSNARRAASGDAARVEVVGTPAVMKPGETLSVKGTLLNTGTRPWTSDGPQPVRLLVRWTDLKTGSSAGWRVVWPQVPVAPGRKLKLPIDVAAPSRAGRYKLTYSLLRLNGSRVVAPSYGASTWPGEFGAIAFLVIVR